MDTITEHEGTFDLHVGLPAEEVERFLGHEFMTVTHESGRRPGKFAVGDNRRGDTSWEQWGEPPWDFNQGGYRPDWEKGHHVIIRCESVAQAIENFAWLWHEGFTLIPARFAAGYGTIGSVSDAHEWSEQYLSFSARLAWQFTPSMTDFPKVEQ